MVTTKTQSDFTTGIVSSLLFSSMLNPTEIYLSREVKVKPKTAKDNIKNLKTIVSKAIDNKLGLFRKVEGSSLDTEIEMAMDDIKNPSQENINASDSEEKKPVDLVKSALNKLYHTFVSYAKSAYASVSAGIGYTKKKIIEGPVRMTLAKFIKVGEYILAALNPQWNMPTFTNKDYDTMSPAMTNHITINQEDTKYESSYAALRYRTD
tara:strand:+ start:5124 stop:5747 length:624 start_codon:yes stop_codon:yes gene_type:complete